MQRMFALCTTLSECFNFPFSWIVCIFIVVKWASNVILIGISLVAKTMTYFFSYLLGLCVVSLFEKCLLKSFVHFSWVVYILTSTSHMDIDYLSDNSWQRYSFLLLDFSCILRTISLCDKGKNCFYLAESCLPILDFFSTDFVVLPKNSLPVLGSWNEFLCFPLGVWISSLK